MSEPMETFVPMRLKRRQSRLVDTVAPSHDPGLLESIGRAFYWQSLLDAGLVESSVELARREGLKPASISHVLRLALLSPELVEHCLAGQQPRTLTLKWLQRNRLPIDWNAQRKIIEQFD